MCRFVSYIGKDPLLIGDLLIRPENSLIKQSKNATKDQYKLNADGFGVAWYDHAVSNKPAIFKSIKPAWNDNNLIHLSNIVKSKCFIAHIRASTIGDVAERNCHPFLYKEYTMAHNGNIDNFNDIRRLLYVQLSDEFFLSIKGNTDSECLFFLIMEYVHAGSGMSLAAATRKAFKWIIEAQKAQGKDDYSRLNIVISNGDEILATRFVTKGNKAFSLSYSIESDNSLVISSEPLDDHFAEWSDVPVNHYIRVEKDLKNIEINSLEDILIE